MSQYLIKDAGDPRKYFIQIPNMIDDSELTVYEFRLYVHLKRVAGDEGKCYQSTQTLAKACKMSTAAVSRAKKSLAAKNLITIEGKPGEHGGRDYHEITITDIWEKNISSYSQKQQVTPSNLQVLPQKLASYPGAIKEEPFKEEPNKNNNGDNHATSLVGILFKASGLSAYPADQLEWVEVVRSMNEAVGSDRTIEVMRSACTRWINTKNKNGKPYRKTDLRWINWAQEELAASPADLRQKEPKDMTSEEFAAYLERIAAE